MTVANPAHVTGDYLLALAIGRNAAATFVAPTQDGGWTQVGSEVNQGVLSVAWFYIKATSSSMTAPSTSHASTQYRALLVFNIGDGDPTTFIDTGFGTSGVASAYDTDTSTDGMTCASGTTTANNCLIMHVAVNDAPRNLEIMPKSMRLLNTVNVGDNLQYCVSWVFQETAGATDTWTIHQTRAINDALSVAIAIRSDAPRVPARHDSSAAQAEIILAYNNQGDGGLPYTDTNIASDLGTIDSITTNDATFANATGSGFNPYMTHLMLSSSTAGQIATQHYLRDSGVNYDCSSGKVSIGFMLQSGESLSRIETLANHGVMVGLTSGTSPKEIAMWDAGGFDTSPIEVQTVIVDANSYIEHEVNTFDWTDVRGFVVAAHLSVGANTRVSLDYVHKLGTIVLIGGWNEAGKSASWSTARTAALSASAKTIDKLGDAYRTKQDIQVGNGGTNAVYFDTNGESLFLPRAGSVASGDMQMQAAGVAVTLYGVSGDTIKLNDPVVSAGNAGDTFTIHASSTSSATWEFNGTISGFVTDDAVSLRNLGAGAYAGLTFLGCGEIAHNNADLTGGVTFDGCTGTQAITITGATEGALQTALDLLAGATFQNSTTYGLTISFTGTGNVSLNAPSNLTVDELLYTSTNASGLTIVVGSSGSSFPSTATGGSATGVTISNDKTLTLNISVTGAEVTLLEDGTATEVDHTETATTTYTYTYTYSSDEAIDIQVYKPGYKPYWNGSVTLGNADQSITVDLETEVAYG